MRSEPRTKFNYIQTPDDAIQRLTADIDHFEKERLLCENRILEKTNELQAVKIRLLENEVANLKKILSSL